MPRIIVEVNGREYPCRQTMGALLRFKRETGKEVTELSEGSVSELVTLMWCCVVSACAADGVEFGMGLMEFADAVDGAAVASWAEAVRQVDSGGASGAEKKSR